MTNISGWTELSDTLVFDNSLKTNLLLNLTLEFVFALTVHHSSFIIHH